MARDPFPPPAFDIWTGAVSLYLLAYAGRTLADLPVAESALRAWHKAGVPARIVANALTTRCPTSRATLKRFYTDTRPTHEIVQLRARFAARAGV